MLDADVLAGEYRTERFGRLVRAEGSDTSLKAA
jgi:hypothetical protein